MDTSIFVHIWIIYPKLIKYLFNLFWWVISLYILITSFYGYIDVYLDILSHLHFCYTPFYHSELCHSLDIKDYRYHLSLVYPPQFTDHYY